MRKALTVAAMAWYFLIFSPGAQSGSVMGPFDHKDTCTYFRTWALLLSEEAPTPKTEPPAPGEGGLSRFGPCYFTS